jgi:trehalose/maltose hydrolase-like predicted phosphorylase
VTGEGFESLLAVQRRCLDRFWDRADVTVEDDFGGPVRV